MRARRTTADSSDASRVLSCINCGTEGDGAFSADRDHITAVSVGPFCSTCWEELEEVLAGDAARTVAALYALKLKDAEAERDTLRAQLRSAKQHIAKCTRDPNSCAVGCCDFPTCLSWESGTSVDAVDRHVSK